jgi:4-hydroxy-3-methylbut-2-en-1-yl diphosphate reductase
VTRHPTSLLLLVPLRIEQLALGAPRGARLLRTGMGPDRARLAAARARADPASAVAVAGLCAGISPQLAAGDVLCATELVGEEGERTAIPGSSLLEASLRARGLRVHAGALLSSSRILNPAKRRAQSADLLGVDMESLWLAAGVAGRPFVVVRVVADAAGRHLIDPRMAIAGLRALWALRQVGEALSEWAAAATSSQSQSAVGEPFRPGLPAGAGR